MATEFLPICDNLFNVISLAAYFCDCVFDMVLGYALLERGKTDFFVAVVLIISTGLVTSQIVSMKWYLRNRRLNKPAISQAQDDEAIEGCPKSKISKYSVIGIHTLGMGTIWRYAKLFVPVDLRYVKYEVRDLCILRLIHAFMHAAPMLLIQSYILITMQSNEESNLNPIKIKTLGGQLSTHLVQQSTIVHQYRQKTFKDLNTISAFLSLFSVCWALASFSKNVSKHNVHRLVLTWLGVIFQFFWRMGTITSRVLSLTAYASIYKKWIFLVIILHWVSMFLWLISPKNAFHGEQISKLKKTLLSGLVAFIYIFAYINLQEANHRQKMTIFYIVMFLENCLLVSLWMVGIWPERTADWYSIPLYVLGSFFSGIIIMIIYYKYFHLRRLGYEEESDAADKLNKCIPYSDVCRCNGINFGTKYSSIFSDGSFHHKKDRAECHEGGKGKNHHHHVHTNEHLKGIFNCRFSNPVHNATKRKKKKPTSFIPPPNLNLQSNINGLNISNNLNQVTNQNLQPQLNINGPMPIPFWRQPLPRNSGGNSMAGGSSETEGSVASSRINIQLKLQEKKQKQLAELKIIEEEIKQGKLGRSSKMTHENEDGAQILPLQPAPRAKKHIDIETIDLRRNSSCSEADNMNILLYQLQQKNESSNMLYNNFSSNAVINAAFTKFSHLSATDTGANINIVESANNNLKQPSASSTMTSTTSENENNSLTRQMVSNRKYHNLANNLNVQACASSSRIGSPSCHAYDHRQSAYNSLEGKAKTDTNRSSNSKNENNTSNSNVNNSSMEKEKSLASQLIKRQMKRANTPEILLAPSHLDSNSHFYQHLNQIPVPVRNGICDNSNNYLSEYRAANNFSANATGYERAIHMDDEGEDSQNVASDIDSQMSLPRSYTLPREFKFNRQGRKIIKNEHFIASTNSSDGDVDSCDDNEDDDEDSRKMPMSQRMRNRRTNNLNKNRILHSPFNNMNPNINIMAQKQYQNSYNVRGHQGNIKVNNLDLINGCIESKYDMPNQHFVNARPGRSRVFMQNAYNRHETKL